MNEPSKVIGLWIALEDAEIEYKTNLVIVTKKRKKYPKSLAKSLGYTLRLQKDSIVSFFYL